MIISIYHDDIKDEDAKMISQLQKDLTQKSGEGLLFDGIWFDFQRMRLKNYENYLQENEANALLKLDLKYFWQTFHLFTYFLGHALTVVPPLKTPRCRTFPIY